MYGEGDAEQQQWLSKQVHQKTDTASTVAWLKQSASTVHLLRTDWEEWAVVN